MQRHMLLGALAGAALAAHAAAGTTYFATNGTTLYRVDEGGSIEAFDIGAELNSLSFDADGRLWGTQLDDTNGNQSHEVYEITDPFGALGAVSRGDYLPGRLGSLSFVGASMLGVDTTNGMLLEIDSNAKTWATAAMLGEGSTRPTSSAYDASGDALYGIRGDALYQFSTDGAYTQTQIGTLTGGETKGSAGGEWFNGSYYHAVNDGSAFHLYTVDLGTGELTELLSWDVDRKGAAGFAVAESPVPAPGAAALLGLGGLVTLRRRR